MNFYTVEALENQGRENLKEKKKKTLKFPISLQTKPWKTWE